MKKKDVLSLIKYYAEGNDMAFRNQAIEIAHDFDNSGDSDLASFIMSLISTNDIFVPQIYDDDKKFFERVEINNRDSLFLPDKLINEISGIINAINKKIEINKFLFKGTPGTGKTECVIQIARILKRELFSVNFSNLIDAKLGQTQKNIESLFEEINGIKSPNKYIFLFDELDSIVLDRVNPNDVREMGRTTSTFLKKLDNLNKNIVIIATTNMFNQFDRALTRRFDYIVDFDVYTKDDLKKIAVELIDKYANDSSNYGKDSRLINKIFDNMNYMISPGELKNIIRSSIAFSSTEDKFDYIKRLYLSLNPKSDMELSSLQKEGYTVREIEHLTGTSKSQVSRKLKEDANNE